MPFAELAELKEYLRFEEDNDEQDDVLQMFLDSANSFIRSYCGRHLSACTVTEKLNGNDNFNLHFSEFPIRSVSLVKLNGQTLSSYQYTKSQVGLRMKNTILESHYEIEVTYDAGYEVTPAELKTACLKLAATYYRQKDQVNVQSRSIGGENIVLIQQPVPVDVKIILDQYRARSIVLPLEKTIS